MLALLLILLPAAAEAPTLDAVYRHMYNLDFNSAQQVVRAYQNARPSDPMGPVTEAAAYLFAEFDRLRILQSEFFTDDDTFLRRSKLNPDPQTKAKFEQALQRSEQLTAKAPPDDVNAVLATLLRIGLHADYLALVEKKNMAALTEVKQSRALAEQLLAKHPDCYDAWLAVGVENYLLSLKPAPVRWFLRLGGAQTDKDVGIARLRITAEKGRYLKPYAQLLLAVAAVRDKKPAEAKQILVWLSTEFPQNRLYREELSKLH